MSVSGEGRHVGTCRICFEGGGDLIAPCLCKGTSKWVHRACLDRWRVRGSNPRALTECCECGFQYHLEYAPGDDDERRRKFFHDVASQTLLWTFVVQVAIVLLGLIAAALDRDEWLVNQLPFQDSMNPTESTGFADAMYRHKETYYFVGLILFAFLVGAFVVIAPCCCWSCCPRRVGFLDCSAFADCMWLGIQGGCDVCCRGGLCADAVTFDLTFLCTGAVGESCTAMALIALVAVLLVGILAVMVACVVFIQRVLQGYAVMQEMRILAHEYQVKDLAGHSGVVTQQRMDGEFGPGAEEQRRLHEQIAADLRAIYGPRRRLPADRQRPVPTQQVGGGSYGSLV